MLSFVECAIKSRPLDFTNEIDGCELRTCFDGDLVDRDPPDYRASINAISSDAPHATTSPVKTKRNFFSHREN